VAATTIYDITVTHMKMGVALPIANNSFKYWDDPGTWAVPSAWTNKTPGNWTLSKHFVGYDDDRAALQVNDTNGIADGAFPNAMQGGDPAARRRWWPANEQVPGTSVAIYYSFAWGYVTTGPGPTDPLFLNSISLSDAAGSGAITGNVGTVVTTAQVVDFPTLETGTVVLGSITTSHRHCMFSAVKANDWTGTILAQIDSIGCMVNPFDWATDGYLQLTNVFPVNGPFFTYQKFSRLTRTPLQVAKRFDPSGGAEVIRLSVELRNESLTTYQNLKRFYDLNKGVPGIPGVPLAIEPNLPGLPNMMMVDITNNSFPLRRDSGRGTFYSGVFTFETVW
jgi:hypothetical protein